MISAPTIGRAATAAILGEKFSLISCPSPLPVTAPTLPATSWMTNNGAVSTTSSQRSPVP